MRQEAFIQACVLACLLLAFPAHAETLSGGSFREIVRIASEFGEAKLVMPEEDTPYFNGKIKDVRYTGFFADCTKNASCNSLILRMTYENHGLTVDEVNAFNAKTKVGKLYINEDKQLAFDFFVNLEHGVSAENLRSSFEWFVVGMRDAIRLMNGEESSEKIESQKDKVNSLARRLLERFRK